MKKAFIPLGISGAFAVFGLVAAVALTGGLGGGGYEPKDYEIEGNGGTDKTASTPDELKALIGDIYLQSGAYYDNLKNLQPSDPDPVPVEGKSNSIGVVFEGKGTISYSTYMDRKLTISQNEKAVYYQVVGKITQGNMSQETDAHISISRKGMYVMYNSLKTTWSTEPSSQTEKMQRDMQKTYDEAITDHAGKWFSVGLSDAHMAEWEKMPAPYDSSYYDWFGLNQAYSIAQSDRSSFINTIDNNNSTIHKIVNTINEAVNLSQEGNKYVGQLVNYLDEPYADVTIDFTDVSRPSLNYNDLKYEGDVSETATLVHVDNAKVPVMDESSGDYWDLFGYAIADFVKNYKG